MEALTPLKLLDKLRLRYEELALELPLPRVNPHVFATLSLLASVAFLSSRRLPLQILLLLLVLVASWLDAPVARKYDHKMKADDRKERWMIDAYVDRLSEGIIFIYYFLPFYPLFILNCVISAKSHKSRRYYTLPLRHILLLYLVN